MYIPRDEDGLDSRRCDPLSSVSAICAFEISLCLLAIIVIISLLFGLPLYFRLVRRGRSGANSATAMSRFTAMPSRFYRRRTPRQPRNLSAWERSQEIPPAYDCDPFVDRPTDSKKASIASSSPAAPTSIPTIRTRDGYPTASVSMSFGSLATINVNEVLDKQWPHHK